MLSINQQQTVLGGSALLILLICTTLLYSLWQWRSDWILAHQSLPSLSATFSADKNASLISAISGEHLFGQSISNGNLPLSNLQLQITGIVKTDPKQNAALSKAYISISHQPSKIYQVGDHLTSLVKVYDITADSVILENDNHFEKLSLSREKLQFKERNTREGIQ